MDLSPPEVLLCLAAMAAGASIQGVIGFGMNLVAVPVVALVEPDALPAALVIAALPLAALMVVHEHHAVDLQGVGWITLGRLPGTALGVWIVAALSSTALSAAVGGAVLLAVAMSLVGGPVAVTAPATVVAGVLSGTMGTAAGIGGPPLALLYQHHDGPVIRSTLASAFLVGTVISTAGLALGGELRAAQVGFALLLMPAVVAGLLAGRRATRALDGRWIRPAVLVFAAATGIAAIARGVR